MFIGTEAACALVMHAAKIGTYGATDLLTVRVLLLGVAMTPATLVGTWAGKRILSRLSDRVFVVLVEVDSSSRAYCSSPASPEEPVRPTARLSTIDVRRTSGTTAASRLQGVCWLAWPDDASMFRSSPM